MNHAVILVDIVVTTRKLRIRAVVSSFERSWRGLAPLSFSG